MSALTPQEWAARTALSNKRSAETRRQNMEWALANGFSERTAFAAATAEILRAHGKPVNAASVRAFMPTAYPFLFEAA